MTVRIIRDIEEAISREVRRINFFNGRTKDLTVLQDTFDPITGENVVTPVEANYYDSSADTRQIQYPHFFVKLLRMKEDRTTGRVIPEYGRIFKQAVTKAVNSLQGFEIIIYANGAIGTTGSIVTTSIFQIRKVQVGFLLRIFSGNNIGTYTITAVTPDISGNHTITVSPTLVTNLPASGFISSTRVLTFLDYCDLNTIKVGDIFTDASSVVWPILSVDAASKSLTLGGVGVPDINAAGTLARAGNVFQVADTGPITFTVMDPSKPVLKNGDLAYTINETINPAIPVDLYYLVRIDSKERASHVDVATRMWEEFNPPRTALPTIVRSALSAEQLLTVDITSGGSSTVKVKDNSNFNIGEQVFIFDDFTPTKEATGDGFQTVFESQIAGKTGTDTLILTATVPDTFTTRNNTKIVSNATYNKYMFHFVDHVTKDVEAAQYWSHEFTFWIQVWFDRQGTPAESAGVIQRAGVIVEDENGTVIFND